MRKIYEKYVSFIRKTNNFLKYIWKLIKLVMIKWFFFLFSFSICFFKLYSFQILISDFDDVYCWKRRNFLLKSEKLKIWINSKLVHEEWKMKDLSCWCWCFCLRKNLLLSTKQNEKNERKDLFEREGERKRYIFIILFINFSLLNLEKGVKKTNNKKNCISSCSWWML